MNFKKFFVTMHQWYIYLFFSFLIQKHEKVSKYTFLIFLKELAFIVLISCCLKNNYYSEVKSKKRKLVSQLDNRVLTNRNLYYYYYYYYYYYFKLSIIFYYFLLLANFITLRTHEKNILIEKQEIKLEFFLRWNNFLFYKKFFIVVYLKQKNSEELSA